MWDHGKKKKGKKNHPFLGSYPSPANTLTGQWYVLCRKRQNFLKVYMTPLIHATLLCVFNILVFSLQCSKPLSCSFLFYKENLDSTPVGESLLMIRVFIPSLHFFYFWRSISIFCLSTTRAWPETAHITERKWISFSSSLKGKREIVPLTGKRKTSQHCPTLVSINSRLHSAKPSLIIWGGVCLVLFGFSEEF